MRSLATKVRGGGTNSVKKLKNHFNFVTRESFPHNLRTIYFPFIFRQYFLQSSGTFPTLSDIFRHPTMWEHTWDLSSFSLIWESSTWQHHQIASKRGFRGCLVFWNQQTHFFLAYSPGSNFFMGAGAAEGSNLWSCSLWWVVPPALALVEVINVRGLALYLWSTPDNIRLKKLS